jgi:two-component system cell cycle response regulator
MDRHETKTTALEETDVLRLEDILAVHGLTLDLVAAYAGDRPLTESEKGYFEGLKQERSNTFYSDLLFAVTHQFFPAENAEELWNKILQHKCDMSFRMERNVRIAVASLDYLSNLTAEIHSPTVISESSMVDIVRLSLHDGLTGLYNHSFCFQKLEMELKRYERYGTVTSFMMIDIDDFKELNDHFGHQEGDKVLAEVGTLIRKETRDLDICCRYGGEEFSAIMPSTQIEEAVLIAERLRQKLSQAMPGGHAVTVSVGVASCDSSTNNSQLLVEKADAALYRAKKTGKNRVVVNS